MRRQHTLESTTDRTRWSISRLGTTAEKDFLYINLKYSADSTHNEVHDFGSGRFQQELINHAEYCIFETPVTDAPNNDATLNAILRVLSVYKLS